MWRFLVETFYFSTKTYETESSKQEIVECLQTLFTEKKGLFASPNLTGRFADYPNRFILRPKRSLAVIHNFETRPAYLRGIIEEGKNGKIKVRVSVRPNSVMGILFLLFVPFAFYQLYQFFTPAGNQNNLLVSLFFLAVGLPILIGMARLMAFNLRNSFENYLKMSSIEVYTNGH